MPTVGAFIKNFNLNFQFKFRGKRSLSTRPVLIQGIYTSTDMTQHYVLEYMYITCSNISSFFKGERYEDDLLPGGIYASLQQNCKYPSATSTIQADLLSSFFVHSFSFVDCTIH